MAGGWTHHRENNRGAGKEKEKKAMDLNGDWMDLFRKILLEQRGGKKEGGRWMGCRKNNHGTEKAKD